MSASMSVRVGHVRRWSSTFCLLVSMLVVTACTGGMGGGCSSGCGGTGVAPLPGGYKEPTASNVGAVRLTRPGLDFLGQNIGVLAKGFLGTSGAVLSFPIPKTSQSGVDICPDNNGQPRVAPECVADIDVGNANMRMDAILPHTVKVSGTIPLRVRDLPVSIPIIGTTHVVVGEDGCGQRGNAGFRYHAFPIKMEIPLVRETTGSRAGYMKVDIDKAVIDVTINSGDVQICSECPGPIIDVLCNGGLNLVKTLVFNFLIGGVKDQIKAAMGDQLCTKPAPTVDPPCPVGSRPNDADITKATKCVYTNDANTCLPTMLGTDGRMDLSKMLAAISPGTTGGFDFVFAATGDMDPAPGGALNGQGRTTNGMTLGLLGGLLPQPASQCVVPVDNPPPTDIPIPDELRTDTIASWPGGEAGPSPHVNIALAGRFLNYATASAYNAGLLCLGVSTEQVPQLQSGFLSVVVPSIKKLTFEQRAAAAAIVTRPSAPPQLILGGGTDVNKDPLIKAVLPKFSIDFYIFSLDRYIRAFTLTADISLPVSLQTTAEGLLPSLGDLQVANPAISNSDVLLEDPDELAKGLGALIGGLSGQLVGGIPPFDLSGAVSAYGLGLTIPDGAIRKLSKGNDDYLGIFASLSVKPKAGTLDTRGTLLSKTIDAEAMTLRGADRSRLPVLKIGLEPTMANGPTEYSYWVDRGTHSPWTRAEGTLNVTGDALFLQGKHTLFVTSRAANQPATEDDTPLAIPFTLDTLAPQIRVQTSPTLTVDAWDFVSAKADLQVRYQLFSGASAKGQFSKWESLEQLGSFGFGDADRIVVEVKDEEGNIGSVSQALVRGRPDPTLGSGNGCECSTTGAGAPINGTTAIVLALALASWFAVRRAGFRQEASTKRFHHVRAAVALTGLAVLATNQGCSCGDDDAVDTGYTGCGPTCHEACGPANQPGLIGSYTSLAQAKDGTIWVAGYDDADLTIGNSWGDLVVGKYDSGTKQVAWQLVDGLPDKRTDGSCVGSDPKSWRGGEVDAGPDVGLWTSLQLDANGQPIVAYYDATNRQLKFAARDGETWAIHAVRGSGKIDAGRYAKMLIVGGKPVIAFLQMEPGNNGHTRSRIVIGRAASAAPRAPADWTFQDVVVNDEGACRARFCDAGQICTKEGAVCQAAATGCTPADCTSSQLGAAKQSCVTLDGAATCATVVGTDYVEAYPDAVGDYISFTQAPNNGPLGLIAYDRVHGNLLAFREGSGGWAQTLVDGETGSRDDKTVVDTGDVGVGASLAIDERGDWHVSYVNGFTEALQYVKLTQGTEVGKPEIVDDGFGLSGPFADGKHVVGDDSFISVSVNGTVTIYYQDATIGTLRVATGTPGGALNDPHTWGLRAVVQPNRFAGFFPRKVPGADLVTNWWRQAKRDTREVLGDVAFVTP